MRNHFIKLSPKKIPPFTRDNLNIVRYDTKIGLQTTLLHHFTPNTKPTKRNYLLATSSLFRTRVWQKSKSFSGGTKKLFWGFRWCADHRLTSLMKILLVMEVIARDNIIHTETHRDSERPHNYNLLNFFILSFLVLKLSPEYTVVIPSNTVLYCYLVTIPLLCNESDFLPSYILSFTLSSAQFLQWKIQNSITSLSS